MGESWEAADTARHIYLDALRVGEGAVALGGVRPLSGDERSFIEGWEAEAYRKGVARGEGAPGRFAGKVAVVTGAAQGFGLGIAADLVAQGGHVVLADLNVALAGERAAELVDRHGPGRATAIAVDVTDEASVADCIHATVRRYGGLDVLVSNAGVLRAGSVTGQPVADFDLVTAVNYRGYFLAVRAAAPVMARQHAAAPDRWFDVIEINSKSGLVGSSRNSAYAGSKFGGIGLTQSFALELVDHGIKVNAICPGNFFDGPLWSDPENGLFVQYLRTGKVPGAQTVADVKAAYEAKVPMGRGCTPEDVLEAIYYLVAQRYETGQALPVTGGQVMLS
jgi:NAD(P)-dependent dehydrogenase (short-subunit alcohol dehydrogenase family)